MSLANNNQVTPGCWLRCSNWTKYSANLRRWGVLSVWSTPRIPSELLHLTIIYRLGLSLVPEGSWVDTPADHIILGLKELPEEDCMPFHAHAYSGPLLTSMQSLSSILISRSSTFSSARGDGRRSLADFLAEVEPSWILSSCRMHTDAEWQPLDTMLGSLVQHWGCRSGPIRLWNQAR